jgi:hypothetical protein
MKPLRAVVEITGSDAIRDFERAFMDRGLLEA